MDSDRRLWMWSDKTLYLCATKQSQARLFKIDQHIVSLDGRGDKVFLLSSKGTLFQANLRNESISKEVAVGFASDYTKLHLDMKGRLWIYDTYSSFTRCFSTVGRLKPLSLPSVIKSKCVKDIEDDGIGKIWIATNNNGICLLDTDNNHSFLVYDTENAFSIPSNHVNALYIDAHKIMWIGTTKNQVAYTSSESSPIRIIRTPINEDVASLMQTDGGQLWVGYDGRGLVVTSLPTAQSFKAKALPLRNGDSLPIVGLYQQPSNRKIWIGTYGQGIMTANVDGTIEPFSTDVELKHVRFLRIDNKGRLWAGTFKDGLFVFDVTMGNHGRLIRKYDRSNSILKSNTISGLTVSPNERFVLVSAINGLYRVDLKTLKMSFVYDINAECMLRDSRFLTWVGSEHGVSVFDKDMRLICNMTTDDGLSHNHVISLIADKEGNVWAATDNGLTYMTVHESQNNAHYRFECHPYKADVGHDNRLIFNRHSAVCLSNGHVLFGAMGCIVDIDPSLITRSSLTGKVLFTSLYVNGKYIETNDTVNGVVPLSQSLYKSEKITLPSSCDIAFSVMISDAMRSNEIRYMYQVDEGEWRTCSLNVITLGTLPVGNHTLRVYAAFGEKRKISYFRIAFQCWTLVATTVDISNIHYNGYPDNSFHIQFLCKA